VEKLLRKQKGLRYFLSKLVVLWTVDPTGPRSCQIAGNLRDVKQHFMCYYWIYLWQASNQSASTSIRHCYCRPTLPLAAFTTHCKIFVKINCFRKLFCAREVLLCFINGRLGPRRQILHRQAKSLLLDWLTVWSERHKERRTCVVLLQEVTCDAYVGLAEQPSSSGTSGCVATLELYLPRHDKPLSPALHWILH
jgi:hypothetical protein